MKLKDRFRAARNAFRGKSNSTETLTLNQLIDFLNLHDVSGSALSEATYFACLKVLSESIGKLPLKVQQFTPEHGIRIAREHSFYRMLNERPNRYMTASVFWGAVELCRNHYGNAYAWIDTTDPKRPQLWLMHPEQVRVYYDNARLLKDQPDLYYQYNTPRGTVTLGSEEVLHFKSHHTVDGLVGVSVREQLASTIQGNVKAQNLVNKMYESGMTAKSVLQYTGSLDDKNVQTLLKGIENYAKGGMKSSGVENIVPIPVGFSLTPLNLKLADSQFIEVKQYSALQIASAFGVKPYQVGDYTKSSYASAEAQQLSFLVDTLLFNIKQYEEELSWKLLSDTDAAAGLVPKFNTSVLLRTEFQTMISTLSTAVQSFLFTPNEARERLDLPHMEGGDALLGNGAAIPVQLAGSQYTAGQAPAPSGSTTAREEEKAWMKNVITETLTQMLG